jgi:hypothetical protein
MHSDFSGLVHIYIQTNTETILYPFALSRWLFNLVLNLCSLIIIHYSSMFIVAEPPELFQLKCPGHASGAVTHLNRNNPSVP